MICAPGFEGQLLTQCHLRLGQIYAVEVSCRDQDYQQGSVPRGWNCRGRRVVIKVDQRAFASFYPCLISQHRGIIRTSPLFLYILLRSQQYNCTGDGTGFGFYF